MTALGDMVLVDLLNVPAKTAKGILMPTVFQDDDEDDAFVKPAPRVGTIVSVGPGRVGKDGQLVPMPPISVGQKVVVGTSKGERVQLDGESLQESTLFLFTAEEVWHAMGA